MALSCFFCEFLSLGSLPLVGGLNSVWRCDSDFFVGYFLTHSPGQVGGFPIAPSGGWGFPTPDLTGWTRPVAPGFMQATRPRSRPHIDMKAQPLRPVSHSSNSLGHLPSTITLNWTGAFSSVLISGVFHLNSLKYMWENKVLEGFGVKFYVAFLCFR